MASETSWLKQVLIALSESDLNFLNEYNSMLTRDYQITLKLV